LDRLASRLFRAEFEHGGAVEIDKKPRRLRIVSGPVHEIEEQLNLLLDKYTATQFAYSVVGNEVHMTVVMLHESVLRMMQIAQPGVMRPN
jgi:hypothetical protein